jgi:hypothetical protein
VPHIADRTPMSIGVHQPAALAAMIRGCLLASQAP